MPEYKKMITSAGKEAKPVNPPLIGVSGSMDKDETCLYILRCYMRSLTAAGAVPLLLSPDMTEAETAACVRRLDGLMLAGGNDIAPELFGQEPVEELGEVNPLRDQAEMKLIHAFYQAEKPIFGICRGIQMLNAALGGTLYQDLRTQYRRPDGRPPMGHHQNRPGQYPSHFVQIAQDSRLFQLVGQQRLMVNSFHHQAVWEPAPCLRVSARGEDGVIEALEDRQHSNVWAVQWHPERCEDEVSLQLFRAFAEQAAQGAAQKREEAQR